MCLGATPCQIQNGQKIDGAENDATSAKAAVAWQTHTRPHRGNQEITGEIGQTKF